MVPTIENPASGEQGATAFGFDFGPRGVMMVRTNSPSRDVMGTVKVSMPADLGVPAEKVWDLVRGCNARTAWSPGFETDEIERQGQGSTI